MSDAANTGDPLIEVLFSAEVLAERVAALSEEMAPLIGLKPLVVPVLSGSFIFAADLRSEFEPERKALARGR